jgi:hypothetical protein
MEPKGGPASIPAAYVSEVRSRFSHSDRPDRVDLKGRVILAAGSGFVPCVLQSTGPFPLPNLGECASHDSILRVSPLLTAAVGTVGALRSNNMGHLFNACYREFKALVAAQTFSTNVNKDDVLGLCIVAFWLHKLSWALIGTAMYSRAN